MTSMPSKYSWFSGLNALRFIAATLVVIMHAHLGMKQSGLPILAEFPILLKGFAAVSFFFVLSGFLITYLLLKEKTKTNTVQVASFYWRRVFRIWPLYFLIVGFGFLFYWELVPRLGLEFEVHYSKSLAVVLYSLFAANLMNSLFHVGGMLHITWSIAVEEQFYLFWAPLMKTIKHHVLTLIIAVTVISYLIAMLNAFNAFQLSEGWQLFIRTLQFHYMGIGAFAAYLLYNHEAVILQWKIFTSKVLQLLLLTALLSYYLFYQKSFLGELLLPVPLAFLYSWLILNVSVNSKRILKLENKLTNFLGNISYGIYMLHMPLVYAFSYAFKFIPVEIQGTALYFISYYVGIIIATIGVAYISHKFFEKPINQWGKNWLSQPKKRKEKSILKLPSFRWNNI